LYFNLGIEVQKVRWSDIIKWWVIDYKESLMLRLSSWFKLDTRDLKRLGDPYIRGMYYTIDLADKLVARGFRVIYANFSWIEYRHNRHGGWPDLIIGKNGHIGLIEVKGQHTWENALLRVVGKDIRFNTNFLSPKRANYLELANDLRAHLFLAYFDVNANDYRFIPVFSAGNEVPLISLINTLKKLEPEERAKVFKRKIHEIKPLTLSELDNIFFS